MRRPQESARHPESGKELPLSLLMHFPLSLDRVTIPIA